MATTAFYVILSLVLIALIKVLLIKKYASEFRGGDKTAIKDALNFAKKHPLGGRTFVVLTIIQYTIATVFFVVFMWQLVLDWPQ